MSVRLNKLMSERGICSRREADRYIDAGLVLVDGAVIKEQGVKFPPNVEIKLIKKEKKVTIILHKPLGIVSTQPEKGYKEALSLITKENQVGPGRFSPSHLWKLAVCGRLDINSTGLLLLTQDGVLAKQIIGEGSPMEKEYLVRVKGTITNEVLKQLQFGLSLEGKALKRAKIKQLEPELLQFILTEGKKRQIRRMCEMVGLSVTSLKRVRIGPYRLGRLPKGKWQYIIDNK